MFYFFRFLALFQPFLIVYVLGLVIRAFKPGKFHLLSYFKKITKHIYTVIEIGCFHPFIRKITILLMVSAALACFEDDISSSNWVFLKYTFFYVFCFSQIFPVFAFFSSTKLESKRLILEPLLTQSKIWLQITSILTILISLTSLFADHSTWFKEVNNYLDNSPKNYSITVILVISTFVFSLITDFSVYVGTSFFLYSLKHRAYKATK